MSEQVKTAEHAEDKGDVVWAPARPSTGGERRPVAVVRWE